LDESLASIKEKEVDFNPNNYQSYFNKYIQVVGRHNFSEDFTKLYADVNLVQASESKRFYNTINFKDSIVRSDIHREIKEAEHKPIVF
jgi:hypothetical protein